MRYAFLVFLFLLSSPAWAKPLDLDLAGKAVDLSAQADAYTVYCGDKGTLAEGFLKKFSEKGVSKKQQKIFEDSRNQSHEKTLKKLRAEKSECKKIEFLIARFEVMRALKDVSYRLNGIDPATLPQDNLNVPDLEALFPPDRTELPLPQAAE